VLEAEATVKALKPAANTPETTETLAAAPRHHRETRARYFGQSKA
jgi:hypothetical protein